MALSPGAGQGNGKNGVQGKRGQSFRSWATQLAPGSLVHLEGPMLGGSDGCPPAGPLSVQLCGLAGKSQALRFTSKN